MKHVKPTIIINKKEYTLKVTLGFWKDLSFDRSDVATLRNNAKRMFECLMLAIFYGNKHKEGWKSLADMKNIVSEESLENIETDPYDLLDEAFYFYLPENLKKKVDEIEDKEDNLKKK